MDVLTFVYFALLALALFCLGLVAFGRGKDQLRLVAVALFCLAAVETLQLADRTW